MLTTDERKLLQDVARDHERRSEGAGWVIYGVPSPAPDFKPAWQPYSLFQGLVERGLLEHFEDWKNDHVRLTDAGWRALASEPTDPLPNLEPMKETP
jgi:hypothetical protein